MSTETAAAPSDPKLALLDQLDELFQLTRQALIQPPEGEFYLVIVPAVGRATCQNFSTIEPLIAALQAHHGQEIQAFVFQGRRFKTAQGGGYLFTPWGQHPLFVAKPAGEPDDDGFLGTAPQLIPPATVSVDEDDETIDLIEDPEED